MGTIYIFGEWQLDTRLYELRCAGKPLELEPKVFDVLLYLIEHRDRVVSNEELIEHLWPGQTHREGSIGPQCGRGPPGHRRQWQGPAVYQNAA